MEKRCILIGAGEFKETFIEVNEQDMVIAADGGYQHCLDLKLRVDLVVSDFDSYRHEIDDVQVLKSQPEKDDTDMMLAIEAGLKHGYREFVIYGGMGGRLEHTLANIQCLNFLCQQGAHGVMISQNTSIEVLSNGFICYDESKRGYISVFSMEKCSEITIENLKYPLDHFHLSNATSRGVDNEFIQRQSKIIVHKGCICIIISKEE